MSQKTDRLKKLSRLLGYTFIDVSWLRAALTHRSFRSNVPKKGEGHGDNERLEFLGDTILSVVISHTLFHRYPQATEGQLSRLRSNLVRRETLAEIAHHFHLGDYLYLGEGELKSGGKQRDSTAADALEAVIGAIYLDGGMMAVESCILAWFKTKLAESELNLDTLKDPKSRLQEYLQAHKQPLPVYHIESASGEGNTYFFTVRCSVGNTPFSAIGTGSSRRRAEQAAAQALLELIKKDGKI